MGITIIRKKEPELVNPMLAAEAVLGNVIYPIFASPKLNGVRGSIQNAKLYARSLKPIPNPYTWQLFSNSLLNGVDGELVVGDYSDEEVFTKSTSGVMSGDGKPDVMLYAFDWYHPTLPFIDRIGKLVDVVENYYSNTGDAKVIRVQHKLLTSDAELIEASNEALLDGYEGLVLRHPMAQYKNGRSTKEEQGFMRYCPWFRSEAIILDIEEGQKNLNVSTINELGYKKKSSHKDNKIGTGRAGSIKVQDIVSQITFNMPVPGVKLQDEMWTNPEKFIAEVCKYKYKPAVKIGGKPRFPQYEGLRSPLDMS